MQDQEQVPLTIGSHTEATQEAIVPTVEDYCRRHLYRGIGLRLEGRFVAPGFAPPPDVMARHLRVEVWISGALLLHTQQVGFLTVDDRPSAPRSSTRPSRWSSSNLPVWRRRGGEGEVSTLRFNSACSHLTFLFLVGDMAGGRQGGVARFFSRVFRR